MPARLVVTALGDSFTSAEVSYNGSVEGAGTGLLEVSNTLLSRTGLETRLDSSHDDGVAAAVHAYAQVLRRALIHALGADVLSGEEDLDIVAVGPPGAHRLRWETLSIGSPADGHSSRVAVAHVPAEDHEDAALPIAQGGNLVWAGIRPGGADDVGRHQVFGRVARRLVDPRSALRFAGARTDATVGEMEKLISSCTRHGGNSFFHLDAHGETRIDPDETALGREVFVVAAREGDKPADVTDAWLTSRVLEADIDVFTTNACFGAEQRVLRTYPFPGRLVSQGVSAAIAARDPLATYAATTYFEVLYGALAGGLSITDAHRAGVSALIQAAREHKPGGGAIGAENRAARWSLQPMLWVKSRRDVGVLRGRRPEPADKPMERPIISDYLGACMHNESLSHLAGMIEDAVWTGQEVKVAAGQGCDLSDAALNGFAGVVEELIRPAFAVDRRPRTGRVELALGRLAEAERAEVISRHFRGPRALCELLVETLPADSDFVASLAGRVEGEAAQALLEALRWGGGALTPCPERAVHVADHLQLAESLFDEALAPVTDNESEAEATRQVCRGRFRLATALPVVSASGPAVAGVPMVEVFPKRKEVIESFVERHLGEVWGQDGPEPEVVLVPYPWTQVSVRQSTEPADAALALLIGIEVRPPVPAANLAWNSFMRRACLAWLAPLVALRQHGQFESPTAALVAFIVGQVDRSAALSLLEALSNGRPDFDDLAASQRQAVERVLLLFAEWNSVTDTDDDALDHAPTVNRAVRLLHTGQHEAALAVTGKAMEGEVPTASFSMVTAHAYALNRSGRPSEAMDAVAPFITRLGSMGLWDQCELLHLLGDLAEASGRGTLATRYFLEERSLVPPALHRRIHNRRHLYTASGADPDVTDAERLAFLTEGLSFASEAGSQEDIDYFADEIGRRSIGLAASSGAPMSLLDEVNHAPSRWVDLARALDRQVRTGELDPLRSISEGSDAIASVACAFLADELADRAERRQILERGRALRHLGYSHLCSCALLVELWQENSLGQLREVAEELLEWDATMGDAHLALGHVALSSGDRDAGVKHVARAFAYGIGKVDLSGLALETVRSVDEIASKRAREILDDHVWNLTTPDDEGGSPALEGMTLHQAIDRAAEMNLFGDVDSDSVEWFRYVSERAWDRNDFDTAILARQHLCDLLRRGGPSMAGDFAEQMGWTATLLKQADRIAEAEHLYQDAIAIGENTLAPSALASLIGRYGNLLHHTGDLDAAVQVQLQALRVRTGTDLPLTPSDQALSECVAEFTPPNGEEDQWLLLLANLGNCFNDAGHAGTARIVVARGVDLYSQMTEEDRASTPNVMQAAQMFARLARDLNDQLQASTGSGTSDQPRSD